MLLPFHSTTRLHCNRKITQKEFMMKMLVVNRKITMSILIVILLVCGLQGASHVAEALTVPNEPSFSEFVEALNNDNDLFEELKAQATRLCAGLEFPIDTFAINDEFTVLVAHTPEGRGLVIQGRARFDAGGNIQLGWLTLENRGALRVLTHYAPSGETVSCDLSTGPEDLVSELVKVSGDTQHGKTGTRLANPFVVEVQDTDGNPVKGVRVTFRVAAGGGRLSTATATTGTNGRAQTSLTLGSQRGVNTVQARVEALDDPVTFQAAAESVDVNGDGIINILDLVLISANFGKTGQNVADVNGDGIVNIVDLVKVAGEIGAGAAAPAAHPQTLEILTAADVRQWLRQAQHANLTDATSQRGLLMLQQLLAVLIPKETSLLPNYPNPFNPETWIPYQLSEPTEVTVHIYGIDGRLIRTLTLGHQPAGMYQSRSRAVYWNGKNEVGESVVSGVYFYTLKAGNFTAIRKMLIRK